MQDLKIGILQFDQVWQHKQANFEKISELLAAQSSDIDLLLLPEMFQTGFTMDVSFAEEMNGTSVQFLKELASSRNCAIYTSLIIEVKQNKSKAKAERKEYLLSNINKYLTTKTKLLIISSTIIYLTAGL